MTGAARRRDWHDDGMESEPLEMAGMSQGLFSLDFSW